MAMRYSIDTAAGRVHIRGVGTLTMPAMIAAVDEVAADREFCSQFTLVFDISGGNYTAELDDGDAFVNLLKRRQDDFRGRLALVVPDSLVVLANLYCLLARVAGIDRMRSFTDVQEAERWCDASADEALP